jgi:aldose 1-epimerase
MIDSPISAQGQGRASFEKKPFGKTADGTAVEQYILTNKNGMVIKIMTYGATLTEIHVPDKDGNLDDVCLGHSTLEGYLAGHPFFGCTTGRVANRIAKGKFTLNGKEYTLAINNGPNSLHGGKEGFDKKVWQFLSQVDGPGYIGVKLRYVSKDGEEGYPGTLDSKVTFSLTDGNEIKIEYSATTDMDTPINLTNHAYFNLTGGKEDILGHEMMLNCDKFTPTDDTLIPTGELKEVAGTVMDFTKPTAIGARIKQLYDGPGKGYDHNYVLKIEAFDRAGPMVMPKLCAKVKEPKSGRVMEMYTTEPGVQFYTGNFLDGKDKGKGGVVYQRHWGFCLEAQHFPNSVNQPNFPNSILRPGEVYRQTTVYKFGAEK